MRCQILAWLLPALILGCESAKQPGRPVGGLMANIRGGQFVASNEPSALFTVWIERGLPDDNISYCTGILIAPRTILTAAHCVHETVSLKVLFGVFPVMLPTLTIQIPSENIKIAPNYIETLAQWPNGNPNDIALIYLHQDVPSDMKPIALTDHNFHIEKHKGLMVAGLGVEDFDSEKMENQGNSGSLRQTTLKMLLYRGGAASAFVVVDHAGDDAFCTGDSGGPAFVETEDKKSILVGVISSLASDDPKHWCRGAGHILPIQKFLPWIREQM